MNRPDRHSACTSAIYQTACRINLYIACQFRLSFTGIKKKEFFMQNSEVCCIRKCTRGSDHSESLVGPYTVYQVYLEQLGIEQFCCSRSPTKSLEQSHYQTSLLSVHKPGTFSAPVPSIIKIEVEIKKRSGFLHTVRK